MSTTEPNEIMLSRFPFWFFLFIRFACCFVDLYDHSTTVTEYFTSYDCIRYDRGAPVYSSIREYCIRKINTNETLHDVGVPDQSHRQFTFYELRELNVSAQTILQWSRLLDLVEVYIDYIDQPMKYASMGNTTVYKCTDLWFGSKCQYSLGISSSFTIEDVLRYEISKKFPYDYEKAELPCFLGFQCLRNGEPFCLDWREICNGEVDCYDGAEDEAFCHELEFNECRETEYRCKNGLCVPLEQFNEEFLFCLDFSGVLNNNLDLYDLSEKAQCFPQHTVVYEILHSELETEYCQSVRDHFRWTWMSNIKKLNHNCWQLLVCLTHVRMHSDQLKCEEFFQSVDISTYLNFCENITMFPENPVASNHVYLLYEPHNLSTYYSFGILLPAYICFNPDLCEHLKPTDFYKNLTCLRSNRLDLFKDILTKKKKWKFIWDQIRKEFHKCLVQLSDRNLFSGLSSNFSAYCCQNSSKCISRHRVMDDVIDCPFKDDEQAYEISCSIKERLSYRCSSEPYCRSPFLSFKLCSDQVLHFDQLLFTEICDRTVHATTMEIDGKNHTDETDCEFWNCNNPYTRCDGYWNCPDGEDEFNCPSKRSQCPRGMFECVSLHNLTMICLLAHQVLDGIQDCLGGSDEVDLCRRTYRLLQEYPAFMCRNETKCLDPGYLCDKKSDCSTADDEIFCKTSRFLCRFPEFYTGNKIEKFLCNSIFGRRYLFQYNFWPIYSTGKQISSVRPQSDQIVARREERPSLCFRGLSIRFRTSQDKYRFECSCPVEYYGDRCQYQTQYVSLIVMLHTPKPMTSISFFAILIDENDEYQSIYSYQQNQDFSTGEICRTMLQFNLIYPNHARNRSKNYTIRIEGFERSSMVFLAGWYYHISFPFLPVYPLVISLHIPIHTVTLVGSCFPSCEHGRCTKYLNENKSYCRCYPGWMGIRCHQKVISKECNPNSILIGYQRNRPICLCPIDFSGERCMIKLSRHFPSNDHSHSFITEGNTHYRDYDAVHKHVDAVLPLSDFNIEFVFVRMKVPSYILVHFFVSSPNNYSNIRPKFEMIPVKVPLFQSSVALDLKSPVDFLFVQIENAIYFFVMQKTQSDENLKLQVSSDQLCPQVSSLLNHHLINLPRIQRVKHYHKLCYNNSKLACFVDELFLCICTIDRRSDCLHFNRRPKCNNHFYCLNGARCFQDNADCPRKTVCVCNDCFFGDRCQFYARGIGLTLDDILRFQIRPGIPFKKQSSPVIVSAIFTGIVSIAIFTNGILSLMTFHNKRSREVGTGLYLLASTVSSILVAFIIIIKYCFVFITHVDLSISQSSMRFGCKALEFLLKSSLTTDAWYNACIAFERLINIYTGIHFNKKKSQATAKWIIFIVPPVVGSTLLYELIYRDLSNDEETNRSWCILQYSQQIQTYSSTILLIHITGPFLINLTSAVYIVISTARQRSVSQTQQTLKQHLMKQLRKHKHLIYSPLILVTLSIPRLIVSLLSGCMKSVNHSWIYLFGYFVSFSPSMLMFFIFVLPSQFYKEEFRKTMNSLLFTIFRRGKQSLYRIESIQ